MSKKVVTICDICGCEIIDNSKFMEEVVGGGKIVLKDRDRIDLCEECIDEILVILDTQITVEKLVFYYEGKRHEVVKQMGSRAWRHVVEEAGGLTGFGQWHSSLSEAIQDAKREVDADENNSNQG